MILSLHVHGYVEVASMELYFMGSVAADKYLAKKRLACVWLMTLQSLIGWHHHSVCLNVCTSILLSAIIHIVCQTTIRSST